MKRHIPSAVQSLHLIAHMLKQQLVFVQVHLQPASQQTEQELHPGCGDHALEEDGSIKETGNSFKRGQIQQHCTHKNFIWLVE